MSSSLPERLQPAGLRLGGQQRERLVGTKDRAPAAFEGKGLSSRRGRIAARQQHCEPLAAAPAENNRKQHQRQEQQQQQHQLRRCSAVVVGIRSMGREGASGDSWTDDWARYFQHVRAQQQQRTGRDTVRVVNVSEGDLCRSSPRLDRVHGSSSHIRHAVPSYGRSAHTANCASACIHTQILSCMSPISFLQCGHAVPAQQ